MSDASNGSHRQMGAILVDRSTITAEQLVEALALQDETGRLLGEICVERWGIDRLALADALSEQWEEMQGELAAGETATVHPDRPGARAEAKEMRALLQEAEAARAELASKTEELTRRLAVLETLVMAVSSALEDLRSNGR